MTPSKKKDIMWMIKLMEISYKQDMRRARFSRKEVSRGNQHITFSMNNHYEKLAYQKKYNRKFRSKMKAVHYAVRVDERMYKDEESTRNV